MAAYQAVQTELGAIRKRRRKQDEAKMNKRIKKNTYQRVWAIEEVIRSNAEADKPVRVRKVRETSTKFIICICLPCEALAKLTIVS